MSDDPKHRQALIDDPHLIFTRASQKTDLLDGGKTQDALISLLQWLVGGGFHFEITAVNSDHDYDGELGDHCHNPCGYAVDGWPLMDATPGAWLDASDPWFQKFLSRMATAPTLHQIGLAGSAWTATNKDAAGPTVFQDAGADHVHLGSQ